MTILPSFFQFTLDLKGQVEEQSVEGGVPFAGMSFGELVGLLLSGVMAASALIVLVFLIWGAVDYMNSGGEKGKIESARNKMTSAVMGLFVLASVLAIFMLIQQMLGIEILRFGPATPPPTTTFLI